MALDLKAIQDVADDDAFWLEIAREMGIRLGSVSRRIIFDGIEAAQAAGALVDMDGIHEAALQATRDLDTEWWRKIERTTRDSLRTTLTIWQEQGLGKRGLPDLVDSLQPLFSRARAKRIAQTESTRLFAEGNILAASQDDSVGGMEWQTSRDELVCFPAFTLVATPTGQRAIESLRVGDDVCTVRGTGTIMAVNARPYGGRMVTLWTDAHAVTCTAEHPFWHSQQGWLNAWEVEPGHTLQTLGHQVGRIAGSLHFRVGDSDYVPAPTIQESSLARIAGGVLVPIGAVNFDSRVRLAECEVDAVGADLQFLDECDAESGQGASYGLLQAGLSRVEAIAGHRAKAACGGPRLCSESLSTGEAANPNWRPAAFLTTEVSVESLFGHKDLAATCTGRVSRLGKAASTTAYGEAIGHRRPDAVCAPTGGTELLNHHGGIGELVALIGAESFVTRDARRLAVKRLATAFTDAALTVARSQMVARPRAVLGALPGGLEGLTAVLAGFLHQGASYHRRAAIASPLTVYNLQVAGSPTFYANGFLVHNCEVCGPRNGLIYPKGGTVDCPAHPNCRCSYQPATWSFIRSHPSKWQGGPIPLMTGVV